MKKISKLNDNANLGGRQFEFFKQLEQYFLDSNDTIVDRLANFPKYVTLVAAMLPANEKKM